MGLASYLAPQLFRTNGENSIHKEVFTEGENKPLKRIKVYTFTEGGIIGPSLTMLEPVEDGGIIPGAIEIGRLPGVVTITMLVPLQKLEGLNLANFVREQYKVISSHNDLFYVDSEKSRMNEGK